MTRRLDNVPEKQADNFFKAEARSAATRPRPRRCRSRSCSRTRRPTASSRPAATRLMASGETGRSIFETGRAIALAPGSIAAMLGVDAADDRSSVRPTASSAATLRAKPAAERALRERRRRGRGQAPDQPRWPVSTPARSSASAPGPTHPSTTSCDGRRSRHHRSAARPHFQSRHPGCRSHRFRAVCGPQGPAVARALSRPRDPAQRPLAAEHHGRPGRPLPDATIWSWWGEVGDNPPDWHKLDPSPRAAG